MLPQRNIPYAMKDQNPRVVKTEQYGREWSGNLVAGHSLVTQVASTGTLKARFYPTKTHAPK
jgi:hypothetical protein